MFIEKKYILRVKYDSKSNTETWVFYTFPDTREEIRRLVEKDFKHLNCQITSRIPFVILLEILINKYPRRVPSDPLQIIYDSWGFKQKCMSEYDDEIHLPPRIQLKNQIQRFAREIHG